jgi:hypothetical protein
MRPGAEIVEDKSGAEPCLQAIRRIALPAASPKGGWRRPQDCRCFSVRSPPTGPWRALQARPHAAFALRAKLCTQVPHQPERPAHARPRQRRRALPLCAATARLLRQGPRCEACARQPLVGHLFDLGHHRCDECIGNEMSENRQRIGLKKVL